MQAQVPGGQTSSSWGQPTIGGARGQSTLMRAPQPTSNPQQRPPAPAALGRATSHRDVPVSEAPGGLYLINYILKQNI